MKKEKEGLVSDMLAKSFKISIGDNIKDIAIRHVEFSWDKLVSVIKNPIKKHVSYSKYAENEANSHEEIIAKLLKAEKYELQYFVGGYFENLQRKNENIKARTLIVLDIDSYDNSIGELEKLLQRELQAYSYIAYSTVSHKREKPCVRVVLKSNKDIHPDIYKPIVENFVSKLTFKNAIDINASTTVSQAMYFPAIIAIDDQPEEVDKYKYEYWTDNNSGAPVNIDDYCAKVVNISFVSKTSDKPTKEYNHLPVGDQQVSECLANYPAKDLDFYGWMEVCMALHYNYRGSETGYAILDKWSKCDLSKYNESKNRELWDGVKDNVANPKTFASILKKVQNIKSDDWQKDIVSRIRDLNERFDEESQLMPIIRGIAMYCSETESEYYIREIKDSTKLGIGVLRGLIKKEHKKIAIEKAKSLEEKIFNIDEELPRAMFPDFVDSDKPPKTTLPNFKVILRAYGITIKRNLISREEEIEIPGQTYCADTKLNASYNQLISVCEMNGMNKNNLINGYCSNIGSQNVYNPVLDYIQATKWDGKSRLQHLYDTILLEDDYPIEQMKLYVRKWLISAVAALCVEKGLKSKGVLIFQGKQSTNKSPWFQSLVPKELGDYFCENFNLNPLDKDSVATGNSFWIVDLGEFDRMMRSNTVGSMKAYISSNKSVLRRAYAAKNEFFYRRNVFCGTVNPKEFLKDRTGNVRYWCIPIRQLLSTEHIDMQQLWAEVYEIYKTGERWWLIPEEEKMLEENNKRFLEICSFEETFLSEYEPYTENKITDKVPLLRFGIKSLMLKLGWNLPIPRQDMAAMKAMLDRLGTKFIKETKEFVVRKLE